MEKNLDRCMDEICEQPGVNGCLIADRQGLCLGVRGKAMTRSSGVITAIANAASRLEPDGKPPIILLEDDHRQCLIQRTSNVTCAIYKQTNAQN